MRTKRAFWPVQWHGFSIYNYIVVKMQASGERRRVLTRKLASLAIILLFQAVRRAVNVLNVSMCI